MTPITTQTILPWAESVDFASTRSAGNVSLTGLSAGVYQVNAAEAAKSNGVYIAGDIRVTLAVSDVASAGTAFDPKPRDVVTYNSTAYTVTSVTGSRWLAFWTLTARNPALAYHLTDTGYVYRPTPENPADGPGLRRLGTPTAVASGVACRLQPEDRQFADIDGRLSTRAGYTLFLANAVEVRAGDFVTVGGVYYEAVSQGDVDTLATLTSVRVERVT